MNEVNRTALIEKLESKVELRKKELRTAIEEGTDNMVELMKGLAVLSGLLLLVYVIFQARVGRLGSGNKLKTRFAGRMAPLLSMALQKGAAIFMGEAIDKLVDYLSSKKADDETENKYVSE